MPETFREAFMLLILLVIRKNLLLDGNLNY
jgi:hypothetical protein